MREVLSWRIWGCAKGVFEMPRKSSFGIYCSSALHPIGPSSTYIVELIPIQITLLIYHRRSKSFVAHVTSKRFVVVRLQFLTSQVIQLRSKVKELVRFLQQLLPILIAGQVKIEEPKVFRCREKPIRFCGITTELGER